MPSQYIVHARIPEGADPSKLISSFSDAFKVSDSRARALISKLPGKVSKSVTEQEARRLAKRFERIGLLIDIVDSESGEAVNVASSVAVAAKASPAPAEPLAASTSSTPENASTSSNRVLPNLTASEAVQTAMTTTVDDLALVPRNIPDLQHNPLPDDTPINDTAVREAKKEAATQALAASVSQTVVVEDPAKVGLDPERDPPPLPRHVAANQQTKNTASQPAKPLSLRRKFALAALAAGLLMLLTSLVASTVLVPRILQQEQRAKTEGIATTFATSIAALIARPLGAPTSRNLLQHWLEQTQPFLASNDVAMVVVTDGSAQVLAGWRDDRLSVNALSNLDANTGATGPSAANNNMTSDSISAALQALIADEVTRANGMFAQQQTTLRLGNRLLTPFSLPADGLTLRTSAQMIVQSSEQGANPAGVVVVGTFAETASRATRSLLVWLAALSLLPLVLGVVIALILASRMRRNVMLLAEQVSDLETRTTPVTLSSGDELETLATSLEHTRERLQPALSTRTGGATQIPSN